MILGKTEEERKQIYAIPLWVALRWLLAVIFLGSNQAERYIRSEDRNG